MAEPKLPAAVPAAVPPAASTARPASSRRRHYDDSFEDVPVEEDPPGSGACFLFSLSKLCVFKSGIAILCFPLFHKIYESKNCTS